MLRRVFGGFPWRQRNVNLLQLQQEFNNVVGELRQLGRQACPSDLPNSERVREIKSSQGFLKLGNLVFENAQNDPTEREKAKFLWKKAVEMGDDNAKFSYARLLQESPDSTTIDIVESTNMFRDLASKNHTWGIYAYATALAQGDGTRKDEKKAFQLFQLLAAKNFPMAFLQVANMLAQGRGVAKNDQEAVQWYTRAAQVGDPMAKTQLGNYFLHGRKGCTKDVAKARELFREAATMGNVVAQYNLGHLFLVGEPDSVTTDELMAEFWFRRAAEKGFVMAMVNLAQMYRTGLGKVPKDLNLARKWLELAAPTDLHARQLLDHLTTLDDDQSTSRSKPVHESIELLKH